MFTIHSPRFRFPWWGLCALWLGLSPAMAALPDKEAVIQIRSQPEGAKVVALGKTWGVTPLDLRLRDAFPALYRPEQPYIGMAVYLRKAGCQEHRTPIHRRSIPAEIRVTLDCAADETQAKPSATPAPIPRETAAPTKAPAVSPASPAGTTAVEEAMPPASVRKKLEELQELRKSGLISEQEYQQLRSRVLDYF